MCIYGRLATDQMATLKSVVRGGEGSGWIVFIFVFEDTSWLSWWLNVLLCCTCVSKVYYPVCWIAFHILRLKLFWWRVLAKIMVTFEGRGPEILLAMFKSFMKAVVYTCRPDLSPKHCFRLLSLFTWTLVSFTCPFDVMNILSTCWLCLHEKIQVSKLSCLVYA